MTSLKQNFYTFCGVVLVQLMTLSGGSAWGGNPSASKTHLTSESPRFIKINRIGQSLTDLNSANSGGACVLDNKTGLLWEIKTNDGLLQDKRHTYSWYEPDSTRNGGFAGYKNKGRCKLPQCNTHAYILEINKNKLCGKARWRLPRREELRSIVDYQMRYPGPTINVAVFPNTLNQFYWSSVPDANDKDSAWGIGFSFGYDYAYFKSDLGYVRLVSEYDQ